MTPRTIAAICILWVIASSISVATGDLQVIMWTNSAIVCVSLLIVAYFVNNDEL